MQRNRSRQEITQEILITLAKHSKGCTVTELNKEIGDYKSRINSILYRDLQKQKKVIMISQDQLQQQSKKPIWKLCKQTNVEHKNLDEKINKKTQSKIIVLAQIDLEHRTNLLSSLESWMKHIDIVGFVDSTLDSLLETREKVTWMTIPTLDKDSLHTAMIWYIAQTIFKNPECQDRLKYTFIFVSSDNVNTDKNFSCLKRLVENEGHSVQYVPSSKELEDVLSYMIL